MRAGRTLAAVGIALGVVLAPLLAGAPAQARPVSTIDPDTSIDYVALGDSYTAGPLVAPGDPQGLPTCFRSLSNYPHTLATMLGASTFTDVSCSGAQSIDLRRSQPPFLGDAPAPQLDAVNAGTDLVTLGMGGNDFGLFGTMTSVCAQLAASDPTGTPCRRHFTKRIHGERVNTKARDAKRIQAHLERAVRDIRAKAPGAEVYLVGYPQLLPQSGTCASVPFASGDYAWGRHVEWLLNRSIRRAASAEGATYVDLATPSVGHDACAGDDAWVNGAQSDVNRAYAYHPFREGMDAAAAAAYARITGTDAPTPP